MYVLLHVSGCFHVGSSVKQRLNQNEILRWRRFGASNVKNSPSILRKRKSHSHQRGYGWLEVLGGIHTATVRRYFIAYQEIFGLRSFFARSFANPKARICGLASMWGIHRKRSSDATSHSHLKYDEGQTYNYHSAVDHCLCTGQMSHARGECLQIGCCRFRTHTSTCCVLMLTLWGVRTCLCARVYMRAQTVYEQVWESIGREWRCKLCWISLNQVLGCIKCNQIRAGVRSYQVLRLQFGAFLDEHLHNLIKRFWFIVGSPNRGVKWCTSNLQRWISINSTCKVWCQQVSEVTAPATQDSILEQYVGSTMRKLCLQGTVLT